MIDTDWTRWNLPPGFTHPHASEEALVIATMGMILRTEVGSGVHGTAVSGQDDRDEMGICLEPPSFITGLARVPNGINGQSASVEFEQYERHTAWDRPGGLKNRSGAGDLDVIIYSARKWARLAQAGNPTVLLPLFTPDSAVMWCLEPGNELRRNADKFISKLSGDRYLGYLKSQKAAMISGKGAHTNRPELVAIHGYDTKYAMHALRLGYQGVELLESGKITLPMPSGQLSYLKKIRAGEVPLQEVLDRIDDAEYYLKRLRDDNLLPPEPDYNWVNNWLHRSYMRFWGRGR